MIPDWNISAVLPPIRPGAEGHSPDRSPYKASFFEVIEKFGTTLPRIEILRGLLNYRTELRNRGVTSGFQWLDGSFMENKEVLLAEPPKDVDVVSFFHLPPGTDEPTFSRSILDLFDVANTKTRFRVDAYGCVLGVSLGVSHVQTISYWYSMWSHRRNGLWKGFIQMDISKDEDDSASGLLDQLEQEMVTI